MISYYQLKLERKQRLLSGLHQKQSNLDDSINTTIKMQVLEAEIRILQEVIEDFQ